MVISDPVKPLSCAHRFHFHSLASEIASFKLPRDAPSARISAVLSGDVCDECEEEMKTVATGRSHHSRFLVVVVDRAQVTSCRSMRGAGEEMFESRALAPYHEPLRLH